LWFCVVGGLSAGARPDQGLWLFPDS
jgi:hypothetical protein